MARNSNYNMRQVGPQPSQLMGFPQDPSYQPPSVDTTNLISSFYPPYNELPPDIYRWSSQPTTLPTLEQKSRRFSNQVQNKTIQSNVMLDSGAIASIPVVVKEQKKWLNSSLLCVIYLLLVTVILISLCGSILSILFIAMDLFGVPATQNQLLKGIGASIALLIFTVSSIFCICFFCTHGKQTNWFKNREKEEIKNTFDPNYMNNPTKELVKANPLAVYHLKGETDSKSSFNIASKNDFSKASVNNLHEQPSINKQRASMFKSPRFDVLSQHSHDIIPLAEKPKNTYNGTIDPSTLKIKRDINPTKWN